ncbi:MAG: LysR substrate-binding domain-containing protein [Amphritea sp.]
MMPRKPNLNLLKTFQRAAFHRNLTRAADELCITQAAVSRQIGMLEEQLGIKLFLRTNRGIELTPEAEPLYEVLTSSLNDIDRSLDALYQHSNLAPSRLAIGVDSAMADNWLRQRFAHFRELNPGIQIELQLIADNAPLPQVDIQIIYGCGQWPGYESELLLQPVDFVVCSPDLIRQGPPLEQLSDLKNHCLINEFNINVWAGWLRDTGATEIDASSGPIVHDAQMCLEMAANGEGVILSDDFVAANYLFDGRLVKPLREVVPARQDVYLLYRAAQKKNTNVHAFITWIKAEIDKHLTRTATLRQQTPFNNEP